MLVTRPSGRRLLGAVGPLILLVACAADPPSDDGASPANVATVDASGPNGAQAPRRIIVLGPSESAKGIARAVEESNVAERIVVEAAPEGWPTTPESASGVDAVLVASPVTAADQVGLLEAAADRGCGLVLVGDGIVGREPGGRLARRLGAARGENIPAAAAGEAPAVKAEPVKGHPVARGVTPFEARGTAVSVGPTEERGPFTPVVSAAGGAEPRVIAWAADAAEGGRGFVIAGPLSDNWDDPSRRTLLLNALCWVAKVEVPAGGVGRRLDFDDQWTPKPHLGKKDLPTEKEEDWRDARLADMDTGPFFTASVAAPEGDMVVKALAIKVGGTDGVPPGGVLFDKATMTLRCGWAGGFLEHSDRRFGLLEMPTIAGDVAWSLPATARWQVTRNRGATGLREARCDWRGLHLDGDRVLLSYDVEGASVLETPSVRRLMGQNVLVRTFRVGASNDELTLPVSDLEGKVLLAKLSPEPEHGADLLFVYPGPPKNYGFAVKWLGERAEGAELDYGFTGEAGNLVTLTLPPSETPRSFDLIYGPTWDVEEQEQVREALTAVPRPRELSLSEAPSPRWGEPLVTTGKIGPHEPNSPFAVDTVTLPHENRFDALFFTTGFDFTPDGTCYVCTGHGDVWKATGVDADLDRIEWRRFATGLYQPLGLKVRDGEIFVLGRDQVTRLHDANGDGEADFYENFNDDLTDLGQSHAYAMCLETDAGGNFYFLKSGAAETPHGGTLLKLSADGKRLDVYATGFRHPNGLGVGPDGTITAADNEGNWVPVTRLDVVEPGEFCGHVPTAHLDAVPEDPGRPLCWLPRVVDNSAGGQVWVPEGTWGPLAGELIHFSYGRCTANLILRERVDGVWQGGAVRLPIPAFLSGVCRGRFRTAGDGADGHLYVCGTDGWSTEAADDGCLQRVRYVGGPLPVPTGLHVVEDAIEIEFPEPVDVTLAASPSRYSVDVWNYRWTREYGSEDYSAKDPTKTGRDPLTVTTASVGADGRRVRLTVPGLAPVMQLRVQAGLRTAAGDELPVDYYGTVHRLGRDRRAVAKEGASSGGGP